MSTVAQTVKRWSAVVICDLFQRWKPVPEEFVSAEDYTALERRVQELELHGYDVELCWGWGVSYRFNETERFHVQSLDEIDAIVQGFIIWIARQYTFDCGELGKPMHPHLSGLTVTPTARRQYQSTERFDAMMERERTYTETLIKSKALYQGSGYNLTPAPPDAGGL